MAFKMKGFPYKSGFKHTGGAHEDHHAGQEQPPAQPEEEKSNLVDGKYTMDQMSEMLNSMKGEFGEKIGTIRFRNQYPDTWQHLMRNKEKFDQTFTDPGGRAENLK